MNPLEGENQRFEHKSPPGRMEMLGKLADSVPHSDEADALVNELINRHDSGQSKPIEHESQEQINSDLVETMAKVIHYYLPQADGDWRNSDQVYQDKCRQAAKEIIGRLRIPR